MRSSSLPQRLHRCHRRSCSTANHVVCCYYAEPSNIMWENVELSVLNRRLRKLVTNVFVLVLLIFSLVTLYAAQTAKNEFSSKVRLTLSCCPGHLERALCIVNLTQRNATSYACLAASGLTVNVSLW